MENKNKTEQGQRATSSCPQTLNSLANSVICCEIDEQLSFLWGNNSFFRSIGYTSKDYLLLYPDLKQYYTDYPEDWLKITTELNQALKSGKATIKLTIRLPLKEGGFLWTQFSGEIISEPTTGKPLFQAEFTDISSLMAEKAEQSRLYSQKQQYFQWMMDTYVGNVYISDMNTYELLYLNQNSLDVLHKTANEVLGKKCYEVIQARNSPCPFCTNDKLREDSFYEWEFDNPVLERTFMIKNRIIEWQGRRARIELSHDMYSAEFKLAKKDQERNAIIQTIPGGFIRVDARDFSTILWYGGGFLELIGYTATEFEEELHSQCGFLHPDDFERTVEIMRNARDSRDKTVVEGRIVTRKGVVKILTMTFSYVSAEESWDGIPSFYSVSIDVTKDRENQARQRQALEDAYQTAKVANDAKTNFLSSMSHDIRTPMNAIMGMAVIAQANLTNSEKVQDCLSKISSSSRHLLGLINEVLDMSKIESGKIALASETVALPDVIEEALNICRPLIVQKHQRLQLSADHVRHEWVVTDRERLQQVLLNLLTNAVKYTPDYGAISLRLREQPSVMPGQEQYEFIVTDNGIGMSEEFVEHIFEPFTRAEDSRISKTQGTGLGMTITDNIVRMMNGTIEIKSKLGEGSQFIFAVTLPLSQDREAPAGELKGHTVLVVDDDQAVCQSATELLAELGMGGEWALSSQEAITRISDAQAKGKDFFALLLDWQMPEIDGLATIKEIREKIGLKMPIIIISAYDYSDVAAEFRLAGADAFITKPLFKSKLAHTLTQFCQTAPSEPVAEVAKMQPAFVGKRILLVEDNDLNREIASEILQIQGFLVDEAENGQQAVEKFKAAPPGTYNGILMDIQMPVMNGYEATENIRALQRQDAKTIPILALTANAFASDLGKTLRAGMNEHIAKPIEVEHLLQVLQRWLD